MSSVGVGVGVEGGTCGVRPGHAGLAGLAKRVGQVEQVDPAVRGRDAPFVVDLGESSTTPSRTRKGGSGGRANTPASRLNGFMSPPPSSPSKKTKHDGVGRTDGANTLAARQGVLC